MLFFFPAKVQIVAGVVLLVVGLAVLLELSFLNGRAKLPDLPVSALLTV